MATRRDSEGSARGVLAAPDDIGLPKAAGRRARDDKVIDFPRDADPAAKYERLLPGFGARIESLHGRGLTVRQVLDELRVHYGVEISREIVSEVGDTLNRAAQEWRRRRLAPLYAFVFVDAVTVRVRDRGGLGSRDIQVALGVLPDGGKDIIAFRITPVSSSAFWPQAVEELQARGVKDILVAVVEHPSEAAAALRSAYPACLVLAGFKHMAGRALATVASKDKAAVARLLEKSCSAPDLKSARQDFDALTEESWGRRYPEAFAYWRKHWSRISAFYALPPAVRDIIRTTTAIDSLTAKLRRRAVVRRGHFSSEEDAVRHLVLGLRDAGAAWKVAPGKWPSIRAQLARRFGPRLPAG